MRNETHGGGKANFVQKPTDYLNDEPAYLKQFGMRLKHFRAKVIDMNRREVEEDVAIEKFQWRLRRYEVGDSNPPAWYVRYLISYGLNVRWLYTGEGSPTDETEIVEREKIVYVRRSAE